MIVVAALVIAAGTVAKYLWPGRRLRETGVPWSTLAAGAALGLVGFVALPLVGLPLGFVLGVYLAEWQRLGERDAAWPSTRRALAAVGWSMLIELAAGLAGHGRLGHRHRARLKPRSGLSPGSRAAPGSATGGAASTWSWTRSGGSARG